MAYYDEGFASDCPLLSEQFSTGLDVQLTGHDLLLPFQDGYLAQPSTILGPTTKFLPEENQLKVDLLFDDDLIRFDSMVPDDGDQLNILDESSFNYGEYLLDESSFNCGEYLPSSPETACLDLSEIDLSQTVAVQTPVVVPEIHGYDARHTKELSGVTEVESVQGGQLNDGSNVFDPDWLMPATIPTLPSLEELESLLSASPEPVVESPSEESKPASEGVWIDGFCLNENMYGSYLSAVIQNAVFVSQPVVEPLNPSPVVWHGNGHVLNTGNQLPSFIVSKTLMDAESMSPSESNLSRSPSPSYDSECDSSIGPSVSSIRHSDRYEPYCAANSLKPERRERKREQNKTAALKYRQKKRSEQGSFMSECEQLEKRNGELKSRVEELTREINYLKGLISEIYSCEAE